MTELIIKLTSIKNTKATSNNFTLAINQCISSNSITGIFGPSGSGKTTLLRTLAGLEQHIQGEIIFNGKTLLNSKDKIFIKAEQRNIGLVFQNSRLFPHLSVHENLVYAQKRSQQNTLSLDEIITLTELENLVSKQPSQLSSGEQQRVALARAILAEPQLLLLDEPLSALDQHNKIKMLTLLIKIQQQLNIPMLYVSHSLAELQQTADNLLVLAKGRVVEHGNIHQVIQRLNEHHTEITISQQTSLSLAIKQHDQTHGLTELQLDNQQSLYLPLLPEKLYPQGKKIRCFIFASDVSITLQEPYNSSIVNHLKGKITHLNKPANQQQKHSVLLGIDCAEQTFYSQISLMSYKKLNLKQDSEVFIQFKASAIKTLTNSTSLNHIITEESSC
ncbi:MAG: molybdenum ABC transporter ATP-binding protein [Gammaproteobacteria bacterium]|nr:MAG: molybdenum ABC transporter ATP-binding protein [Gammaproteobacteria bacterium]